MTDMTSGRVTSSTRPLREREGSLLGPAMAILLALIVLPPIWFLLKASVTQLNAGLTAEGLTFDHYIKLLTATDLLTSLINSVIFSICAMLVSLTFGGVLAWIVVRTDAPFKGLAFLTTIISLGTPYILYVTGWLYLLGRSGPINASWKWMSGRTELLVNVNSLTGMILIEGFLWSPLVFLLLSATFRAANAEMEEAARMSGATIRATIWRISFRLAFPAIAALALFVFVRNLESFEVPALVGMPGRVQVLTTEIYTDIQRMPPDVGYASAYSVVMICCIAVLLYFYGKISAAAERYAGITGKGYRPRPFRLGGYRWAGGAIILLNFLIVLVLPLAAILWMAITPFMQPMRLAAFPHLTLAHFQHVLEQSYYRGLFLNTIVVATATATVVMVLTLFVGWVVARRKPFGKTAEQLVTMPLVFPGLVLGLAVLQLGLSFPLPVYGTLWIISFGFIVRYMPYGMRYTYAGILQIHRELEQAAAVSGANTWEIIRRVVVPLLLPALASGWLFIFLIATKEMSMPLLLAGPGAQTIPVAMFDLWSSGQSGEVAALGLVWAAIMTILSSAFYLLTRRASAKTFG
jgi:iron(III) transport system permease protein